MGLLGYLIFFFIEIKVLLTSYKEDIFCINLLKFSLLKSGSVFVEKDPESVNFNDTTDK